MKIFLKFMLCIVYMWVNSLNDAFSQKSDWENDGLYGRVKNCKKFKVKDLYGDYIKSKLFTLTYYHNDGRRGEAFLYNSDGSLVSKVVYEYDNKGNKKETHYGNGYSFISKYKYDENGNELEVCTYSMEDGKLTNKTINKFQNNNKIESYIYDSNGNLNKKNIYVYDEKNNMTKTEQIIYDKQGNYTNKTTFTYNNKSQLIEVNEFNSKGFCGKIITSYNDLGQKTEENGYDKDNKLCKKIIYKYNNKGNCIMEIETKGEGEVFRKGYIYEYEYYE